MSDYDSTIPLKQCTKCKQTLPATTQFFYASKQGKFGLHSLCKSCKNKQHQQYCENNRVKMREYARTRYSNNPDIKRAEARRFYRKHRETLLEKSREYRALIPDEIRKRNQRWYKANQEKAVNTSRDYRKNNPDKVRESKKKYYVANADAIRKKVRDWYKANPEKVHQWQKDNAGKMRANEHRRRARVQSADGSWTTKDIELQVKAQTDSQGRLRCWWCSKPMKIYHRDHRIPLARGGTNFPSNLCLACPKCNMSKGAKLPHEWNGRLL